MQFFQPLLERRRRLQKHFFAKLRRLCAVLRLDRGLASFKLLLYYVEPHGLGAQILRHLRLKVQKCIRVGAGHAGAKRVHNQRGPVYRHQIYARLLNVLDKGVVAFSARNPPIKEKLDLLCSGVVLCRPE